MDCCKSLHYWMVSSLFDSRVKQRKNTVIYLHSLNIPYILRDRTLYHCAKHLFLAVSSRSQLICSYYRKKKLVIDLITAATHGCQCAALCLSSNSSLAEPETRLALIGS